MGHMKNAIWDGGRVLLAGYHRHVVSFIVGGLGGMGNKPQKKLKVCFIQMTNNTIGILIRHLRILGSMG